MKIVIKWKRNSHTGNRTRIGRVRACYPNLLDYMGPVPVFKTHYLRQLKILIFPKNDYNLCLFCTLYTFDHFSERCRILCIVWGRMTRFSERIVIVLPSRSLWIAQIKCSVYYSRDPKPPVLSILTRISGVGLLMCFKACVQRPY